MIFGLDLTLFLYLAAAALYRVIRPYRATLALFLLVLFNGALLHVANPVMSFYLAAQCGLTGILFLALNRVGSSKVKGWPWLVFLGLVPINMQAWFGAKLGVQSWFVAFGAMGWSGVAWTLGANFFVIKCFVVLKEALKARSLEVIPALASLTFVPSFAAGPICGAEPWRPGRQANSVSGKDALLIAMKIGWGGAALYVISPWLKGLAKASSSWAWGVIPDLYLSFAALYFDFSGYSLLAIACGAMFGVRLPENFNRPYLATNIQQFWQRWHMSLNAFIGTYLFKPFVRVTGSPRTGIFLAFVCVGLWHKISLGYLAWGVGHGLALSLVMKPPTGWVRFRESLPEAVIKTLSWILTMTWVAALSYAATHSNQ